MKEDFPPVPILNRKVESLPGELKKFTIADSIIDCLVSGWGQLNPAVMAYRWLPNVVGAGFVFLALLAWVFHRPKRKRLVTSVSVRGAPREQADAAMLEPI
jgi:hypothetical protein